MKKILIGALFGIILAVFILSVGANTRGAPVLAYVYSNSMEPLIKVNDAFIVWPTDRLQVGDIIMFRPSVLKAPYITHRIIGIGEFGYITKGDNAPYKDQESGEPEIQAESVIGKVLVINGQPLVFPGLGAFSESIRAGFGKTARYLAVVFFALAILTAFAGKRSSRRKKPRHRLRLRHVYRFIIFVAAGIAIFSVYLGTKVTPVRYLVSEYPGSRGDQVEVKQPGRLMMEVKNDGVVPVWTVLTGITPLSVHKAPEIILPRAAQTVVLDVLPHADTGLYQGYVQIYNYPVVLPRSWIIHLHRINPLLATSSIGITVGFLFHFLFRIINHIHGLEEWIPLRAIRDKIANRRFNRAMRKLLGRQRLR